MSKYEIGPANCTPSDYDYTEYRKFVQKVKPHFETVKSTPFWWFKNFIVWSIYIICFYYAVFNQFENIIFPIIAGVLWPALGFVFMHDGCHYAVS